MMTCPDCGQNLDDVPVGAQCPSCSGTRRSATVTAAPLELSVDMPAPSIKIRKHDVRRWTEKWSLTLLRRDALARAYAGETLTSSLEGESRALDFFVECHHLREWLEHDTASQLGVSSGDIVAHFQSSMALRACNAICNTHKHHTRSSGTTARIREVITSPQGFRISIEVDWATPAATTFDALDLVNECVASWRSFFAAHGINEP